MDAKFRAQWFGSEEVARQASRAQLESAFWGIVAKPTEPVLVAYGADLDTSKCGSGFPTVDMDAYYGAHPWNVNNFAKHKGSMLRNIDDQVGVPELEHASV